MDARKIIGELQSKYPGKNIVTNNSENPTEIICEIQPTSKNSIQSKVIAIINQSIPHYHIHATEEYTVLKGTLILTVDGKEYRLAKGQSFIIYPMQHHSAKGKATWIECISTPGWKSDDHILLKQ